MTLYLSITEGPLVPKVRPKYYIHLDLLIWQVYAMIIAVRRFLFSFLYFNIYLKTAFDN